MVKSGPAPEYGEEEPYRGGIRYVNLSTQRLRASMEEPFFVEHRAFEWEREFRLAISVRMAGEFAVQVPNVASTFHSTLVSWFSRCTSAWCCPSESDSLFREPARGLVSRYNLRRPHC